MQINKIQINKKLSKSKSETKVIKPPKQYFDYTDDLNELDHIDMEFLDQIITNNKYNLSSESSPSEKEALDTILEIKENNNIKNLKKTKPRLTEGPPLSKVRRLDRILEHQPSPARIKAIKKYLRRRKRKNKRKFKKKSKIRKEKDVNFLPTVKEKVKKSKSKVRMKGLRSHRPKIREFEPFKITSAYGKFMSDSSNKNKFRSTFNSNTRTDYTTPSLPNFTDLGAVPTPMDFEDITDPYKNRTNILFSPVQEGSKTKREFYSESQKIGKSNKNTEVKQQPSGYSRKLRLYLPGLQKRDISPKLFSKLSLNSQREKLPRLK